MLDHPVDLRRVNRSHSLNLVVYPIQATVVDFVSPFAAERVASILLVWRKIMTLEQVINDISALPASDQLQVVQAIWDRLPKDVGTELSAAQQAELDRRWAEYKADPSTALTEDEFRERIRIARGR